MDESDSDETRVLPTQNQKQSSFDNNTSNRAELARFLLSHKPTSKGECGDVAFVHEMKNVDESTSKCSPTFYGTLEHLRSLKSSLTSEDKSLPKKVRSYYEGQLELITWIENVLLPKDDEANDHATSYEKRLKRTVKILTITTLIINIILGILKIIAAIISKSLSVISSVVDSVVDLMTSLILIWTARKIKNRNAYKYPGGRTRLEPIAVVILSVIMCSASVQVIYESAETLVDDAKYLTNRYNVSSVDVLRRIDMSTVPIVAMALTIVSKSILFVLCYRLKQNPTMYAVAEDSRNDIGSNIVALVCGLIAYKAQQGKLKIEAIVIDPVGAILISIYIIIAWILQANRQVRHLTGLSAEPSYLQKLTHVIYNYRSNVVTKIDSVQAIHLGTNYLVEVGIALPAMMPLCMTHDIGAGLQAQLETIDDVERALVHLDFQSEHMPGCEHKIV